MNAGRIEQIDTPTALYDQPANAFVLDFLGGVTFLDARVRAASRRRSTGVQDKASAERIAREWVRAEDRAAADEAAGIQRPSSISLVELAAEFLEAMELERAPSYVETMKGHLRTRVTPELGEETVADQLTRDDVEELRRRLLAGTAKYNSRSCRRSTSKMGGVLEFGVAKGYLRVNPARNVRVLKERTEARHRALYEREIDALCKELRGSHELIFGAACRRTALRNAWERTGLGGRTPSAHDFRHTFASRAISRGLDLEELRRILGHRSVMTTQRYIHEYGDYFAKTAAKRGGIMTEIWHTMRNTGPCRVTPKPNSPMSSLSTGGRTRTDTGSPPLDFESLAVNTTEAALLLQVLALLRKNPATAETE